MTTNTTTRTDRPASRWGRVWRPLRRLALTSAVLAGAVAWTSSIDTPWRHDGQPVNPVALRPTVVQPLSDSAETRAVARLLQRRTSDTTLAQRIASAIVSQGRKHAIEPSLLVGVMLTENSTLNPHARSNVGARGLFQVMPFHSGHWGCDSKNLYDVEGNVCHGVGIIADLIKHTHSTETALLRYNGCVKGTNTPNCQTYPEKVLDRAKQASAALFAMATSAIDSAPSIR